jgi:N-acetylmuramoyl-L-alanine amidase
MFKVKHLFENIWFGHRGFSKKVYTAGLVIFSGVFMIAVVMLSVNGFAKTKTVDHIISYEIDDDEQNETTMNEAALVVDTAEESSYYYIAWAIDNKQQLDETEVIAASEEVVTLAKEEDQEKVLRTSTNNLEESQIDLISMKDYTALVRIVEAEATNEDLKGKILVANVVLNRIASQRFPNTIYEVVHQQTNGRYQFSPIPDGRYYSVKVKDSTVKAVEQALKGVDYSKGAMFFVAKSLASDKAESWFDNNLTFVFQHGSHSFYKY